MVNENDLEEILAQELERIKECGGRINLAEIERRTGISGAILRRWQKNGYAVQPLFSSAPKGEHVRLKTDRLSAPVRRTYPQES